MNDFSLELIELIAEQLTSVKDISNLSVVNQHFYSATTRLLYKNVMINNPRQYIAFKGIENRELKRFVSRLDFSSYTTRGSRWTEEKAKSIILGHELAKLIGECDQLKELFVGEEMMHALVSPKVIQSIFNEKNKLKTIDFTGFCDRNFTTVMTDFFKSDKVSKSLMTTTTTEGCDWSIPNRLENISFYMCMALSQEHFFIPFFDKLYMNGNNQLKRLDLAYTQITSELFRHIKDQKNITHLNLQGCHSIKCCSPLIEFIKNSKNLIQLNLNMEFNGIGGSRFCHECIEIILKSVQANIKSLDMGGHVNFDDSTTVTHFPNLTHLSITYCKNMSLEKLISFNTPNLFYLNLSRTPLTMDLNYLPRVLNQLSSRFNQLNVIEISPFTPKKYPTSIQSTWNLSLHGRRSFYAKHQVNPNLVYSKKLLMLDNQLLSPMVSYWCYSY